MTTRAIALFIATAVCYLTFIAWADDRLWLDAKINGRAARLCFDSSSSDFVLSRETAQRLGLKITEPATNIDLPPGEVAAGVSDVCDLSLENVKGKARFRIIDLPNYVSADFDGVVGWRGLKNNILQIDAQERKIKFLKKAPKRSTGWVQLAIATNSSILEIEADANGTNGQFICIDTGAHYGVALPSEKWQAWKAGNTGKAMTVDAFYSPGIGIVAREEGWSEHIQIGPLILTQTPVEEAIAMEASPNASRYECTLGIAALRRLDMIIDGPAEKAYLRPKTGLPSSSPHNRSGVAFIPGIPSSADNLVAFVASGGPAQYAGIENGDILLKIDDEEVTRERADALSRFWMPAGTIIRLTLKREGRIFDKTIVLRDILSSNSHEKN